MSATEDDRELVRQAASGDRIALERVLLSQYGHLLCLIASEIPAHVRPQIAAEDVLQQTFVQVFRDINKYEPREGISFYAWLQQIARNRLRDTIRSLNRKKRGGEHQQVREVPKGECGSVADLVELLSAEGDSPSREAAKQEGVQAIRVGLAGLPDDQRRAVQLRLIEGHGLHETAAAMNRTPDAIRGLIHRGKQGLREALGRSSLWLTKK
jgi:RNA polymerase sigma-70 factor (ECF subfamily)